MSVVTNVMVTGLGGGAERAVAELNRRLSAEGHGELNEVSGHAGGPKALEADVWLGAFNYLDTGWLVEAFAESAKGVRQLGRLQLFVKRQDDDGFVEIDPAAAVDYHYRDATSDRRLT